MHPHRYSRFIALLLTLVILPLAGCLFRTPHPVQMRMSTADLKEAALDQLVESINANAAHLQSLAATVDIDSSMLEQKKARIKDNPQIRGYVRVRKPAMLRLIGLVPVLRTTALDMVSNGKTFELSIPSKNEFRVGSNQVVKPSPQPLENIRPQHIFDALLLKPVDTEAGEIAILEHDQEIVKDPKSHQDVLQPTYVVLVIAKNGTGYYLSRKIVFSRTDLLPHEQLIYDPQGQLTTHAHYENFTDHGGMMFPDVISIQRPIEAYAITLSVVKLNLNEPFSDDQFVLARPPGSKLIDMDNKNDSAENQPVLRENSSKKP